MSLKTILHYYFQFHADITNITAMRISNVTKSPWNFNCSMFEHYAQYIFCEGHCNTTSASQIYALLPKIYHQVLKLDIWNWVQVWAWA